MVNLGAVGVPDNWRAISAYSAFGANPAVLEQGNPLTFRDDRHAIAVTASGQILMVADMRALHLDTLLQTADSAPARKSQV